MSVIRSIYHGVAPPFSAKDQHPDAGRYGPTKLPSGLIVYVDALDGPPTIEEIVAVLAPPAGPPPAPKLAAAWPIATAKLEQHLSAAIAELGPPREQPMRGMKRLAFLTQDLVKNMDAEADKVADEIQQAHDRAQGAIDKFRQHGADIRKVADDIEAALGQITNSPTEASTGSPATTSG
ncbi:hypothetical protein JQ599_09760 [Bradyrhizobium diazoefficiens]|nr:hypothetical protein [Bradyrhizobium diazoefficiens]MBR0700185.1 hypothetical protein [Bradyrhizobium diazoefficiens]MBR0768520.1 hypothetical protein [Bradyrhizobium diazoefficiens]